MASLPRVPRGAVYVPDPQCPAGQVATSQGCITPGTASLCPPGFVATSRGCISSGWRQRFWKSAKPLGDATADFLRATLSPAVLQAYSIKCSDPDVWASDDTCQSLYPEGAQAASGGSGCSMPDTSSFQAKINDLEQNWNPTGVYTCSDINTIVGKVMGMVNVQHNAVIAYQASYDTNFLDKVGDQFVSIGQQALSYLFSCNAHYEGSISVPAKAGNTTVGAPGLKDWVTSAMSSMLEGMTALGLAACTRPFFLDALNSFDSAISSLWGVAKSIAGAALTVAEASIQAVESGVGAAAWLAKWLPTGIIGLLIAAGAGVGFHYWNKRTHRFPSLLTSG